MDDKDLNIDTNYDQAESITRVTGMYKDWFLDYASYVILERAVPSVEDGFKPVQRRILHSMKDLDDGRFNKVANIVGHTMQYHPHGDASISDAMVQIGQKDFRGQSQEYSRRKRHRLGNCRSFGFRIFDLRRIQSACFRPRRRKRYLLS